MSHPHYKIKKKNGYVAKNWTLIKIQFRIYLDLDSSIFYSIIHLAQKNIYLEKTHGTCGVKELNSPGPLHIEPKAHAEEEETPEDEQRESKFPGDIAEDNPVLGQPRS